MGYRFVNGAWVYTTDDGTTGLGADPLALSTSEAVPASTTPLTTQLNALPAQQSATISFSDGLTNNGLLATTTGWRFKPGANPPYSNVDSAHKWGGGDAATGGGSVKYYFDPSSNWTSAEQTSFSNAFQLWSDEANITFESTTDASAAQVSLYRYGTSNYPTELDGTPLDPQTSGAYATAANPTGSPGDSTVPQTTAALISLNTTGSWSNIASFSANNGYGVSTVVHEIGHVLGLDHTGPYNADDNTESYDPFQFSPYDSELYSIMSYISPTSTGAPFFGQYPVTGTNWAGSPFTPMMDDILAAQQLYGAPTSGDLTETQTFGFNTTITDATKSFFDFNIDTKPIVTLFDTAADNTLDLSGWSTPETINLAPGSFSSADGLVNNIAIAYNTAIDHFIGGSGSDTITANSLSDEIDGGGGSDDTVIFKGSSKSYDLSRHRNTVTVSDNGVTDTLSDIEMLRFSDASIATSSIACFATGTRIATPNGEVAVEQLQVGALVVTADGSTQAIQWIGRRSIDCTRHPRPDAVLPVRIAAHALGPRLPSRDLMLSPDHALFLDEVLIPVKYLLTDGKIAQVDVERVSYWHVQLPVHAVIIADGLPVESYLDIGDRSAFENSGDVLAPHPVFACLAWENACAPLVICGPQVDAVLAKLRRSHKPATDYRAVA